MTSQRILLAITLGSSLAYADDDDHHHGHSKRPKQLSVGQAPAVWKTECASCHMAYPPGLLPAAAWKQQMDTLKNRCQAIPLHVNGCSTMDMIYRRDV